MAYMEQLQVQVQPPPPPPHVIIKCPRCDSSNTKFCYYNNYSLSQPRHLCKACKRYWTRGGSLRKVPVGGGCRKKNKTKLIKPSSSSSNFVNNNSPFMTSSLTKTAAVQSSTKTHINHDIIPCYSIIRSGNIYSGGLGFSSDHQRYVTSHNFGSCNNMATTGVVTSSCFVDGPRFGSGDFQQQNMVSSGFTTPQTIPYGFLGLDEVQMMMKNEKMEGHDGNTTTSTNYDHQNYINEDHETNLPFMWHDSSSNVGSSVPSLNFI